MKFLQVWERTAPDEANCICMPEVSVALVQTKHCTVFAPA